MQTHPPRRITLLALLALLTFVLPLARPPVPAQAQQREQCFEETGFCVRDPILTYWEVNGGLPIFGYPISPLQRETVEDRILLVQWFERDRLEIQLDGTVTAGRLGARLLELRGTPWQSFPPGDPTPTNDCTYFPATQHRVCGAFRAYWLANGSTVRFGLPITEPLAEVIEGQPYTVQYFERRRMEYHPELPNTPVLLGLLGASVVTFDTPTCPADPAPELAYHMQNTYLQARLGCPQPIVTYDARAAEQFFERGTMLYVQPPGSEQGVIYVSITSPLPVRYEVFADTWQPGEPETGNLPPPPGLLEPKRGFGKLWRENAAIRNALGWATTEERQDTIMLQPYATGLVLWLRQSDFVYHFFTDDPNPSGELTAYGRSRPPQTP